MIMSDAFSAREAAIDFLETNKKKRRPAKPAPRVAP